MLAAPAAVEAGREAKVCLLCLLGLLHGELTDTPSQARFNVCAHTSCLRLWLAL